MVYVDTIPDVKIQDHKVQVVTSWSTQHTGLYFTPFDFHKSGMSTKISIALILEATTINCAMLIIVSTQ